MPDQPCDFCGHPVPPSSHLCPHCARPSLYPNVRAAGEASERKALVGRYNDAVEEAKRRGCEAVVCAFEMVMAGTKAVIARSWLEMERLTDSDKALYSTYYRLLDAEVKLPAGDRWDPLRRLADEALFPEYKQEIRFGALSVDGYGMSRYGECFLVLKEELIAHRASVFETNSALLMAKYHYNLPAGRRAVWADRASLCVAKLASELQEGTESLGFSKLLLEAGPTAEEDRFVEVHIWGPITRRTLERVVLDLGIGRRPSRSRVKALQFKLRAAGVGFEEKS